MAPTKCQYLIHPPYSISRATSIDSDCCRLTTASVLSNKADKTRSNQFWSTRPSLSRPHVMQKYGKLKYRGPWWWGPWAGEAGARASIQPSKALCIPEKRPTNLARLPLLVGPHGMKTDSRSEISFSLRNRKPPGSRLWFSRTGVEHSPGSSTIELPSALAESGAYSPDRALPGFPRQCPLSLACHH